MKTPTIKPIEEMFELFIYEPRKFKYRLENYAFISDEKKLLKIFIFFKKNKFNEALEQIKSFKSDSSYFEGIRYYFWGLILNQTTRFRFASEKLIKSVELLRSEESDFIVKPLIVLFLAAANSRNKSLMTKYLKDIKDLQVASLNTKFQIAYCEALYHYHHEKPSLALNILEESEEKFKVEINQHLTFFLTLKFMIYFQLRNWEACEKSLESYKKSCGPMTKANYTYMKTLYFHLKNHSPIYIYPKEFTEYPELYHQIQIIQNLAEGDLEAAKNNWNFLQRNNPLLYQPYFNFTGEHCLFSEGLKKYKSLTQKKVQSQAKFQFNISNRVEKLHHLLNEVEHPISRDEIISYLWPDENYSKKLEDKFHQLVSRYRKRYNQNLKPHLGFYQIKKAS